VTEYGINKLGEEYPVRIKKHPAEMVSSRAWVLVHKFCSEFGLSPVARTRLAIGKEASSDDDLGALLSRPRERKPSDPTTVQ
jgi:P27 family predicted phage terminase small subunit